VPQCVWGEILLSNPRTATTSEAYHEEKGVYNAQRHESSALSSGSDGTLTKLLSNHFLFAGAISLFVWLWLVVNDHKFLAGIVFFSHTNQSAVLFHEPATKRTSQPNKLLVSKRYILVVIYYYHGFRCLAKTIAPYL